MLLVIVSRIVNSCNRFRSFPQPESAPQESLYPEGVYRVVPVRNNIKDSEQKVKKWLKTVSPKEEETDEEKDNDISKHLLGKERIVDFSVCPFKVSDDDLAP